jgi:ABC-type glutathione transport system ATPase component
MTNKLLEVDDLNVKFKTPEGDVTAVNGLGFSLERGQTFGIVGESGSGKSQSMLALMGLLASNGRATGRALFNGQDLLTLLPRDLNRIRGNRVAMIFQDPMTSLNPYLTVERQMTEVLELHKGLTRKSALTLAISHTSRWQARRTARSSVAGTSGGRCAAHRSNTKLQRSLNGQPTGRRAMLGGTPGIATSRSPSWSIFGTAPSRPSVYGCVGR